MRSFGITIAGMMGHPDEIRATTHVTAAALPDNLEPGPTTKDLEAAPPAAGSTRPQKPQKRTGRVCIHLLRGEGLVAPRDLRLRNGTADPFVKLTLGRQTFTSETFNKTLDPHWNTSFEFKGVDRSVLISSPLMLRVFDWDPFSKVRSATRGVTLTRTRGHSLMGTAMGSASLDLSPLLLPRSFLTSFILTKKYHKVELTTDGLLSEAQHALGKHDTEDAGRIFLSVSWDSDDETALSRWLTGVWGRLLEAAARCISSDHGPDPMNIPAIHAGKAWAERQYYLLTFAGPRAGELSDHPVSLGWLHQMVEEGHLPRDLKVCRVEGGKTWVAIGHEISQVLKSEHVAVTVAATASPGGAATQ